MSAKNERRGFFSDQSATPLNKKEKQQNKREYEKQQKEKQKPIPCDTDTDCMRKNGGDGGLE